MTCNLQSQYLMFEQSNNSTLKFIHEIDSSPPCRHVSLQNIEIVLFVLYLAYFYQAYFVSSMLSIKHTLYQAYYVSSILCIKHTVYQAYQVCIKLTRYPSSQLGMHQANYVCIMHTRYVSNILDMHQTYQICIHSMDQAYQVCIKHTAQRPMTIVVRCLCLGRFTVKFLFYVLSCYFWFLIRPTETIWNWRPAALCDDSPYEISFL